MTNPKGHLRRTAHRGVRIPDRVSWNRSRWRWSERGEPVAKSLINYWKSDRAQGGNVACILTSPHGRDTDTISVDAVEFIAILAQHIPHARRHQAVARRSGLWPAKAGALLWRVHARGSQAPGAFWKAPQDSHPGPHGRPWTQKL